MERTEPTSWYGHYHGRSVGRILHFINVYCGLPIAEIATVGNCKVELYGDVLATFEWEGDTDMATFTFFGKNAEYYTQKQTELRGLITAHDRYANWPDGKKE